MLNIVVYLLGQWESFHRRPMLEAFARNAEGMANILCVNPPFALALRPTYWRHSIHSWRCAREGVRQISSNLYVCTPMCWLPSYLSRRGWGESFTRSLLSQQILWAIRHLGMEMGFLIVWVFRPEQLRLLGLAGECGVVYECHDEYQVDKKTGEPLPDIKKMELALLARTDVVFATTEALREKRSRWHPRVHLVPNGVDVELFDKASDPDTPLAPQLQGINHPIVGYPGHLGDFIDIELLEYIAEMRPEWSLALLGEVGPRVSIKRLRRMRNVYLLGPQPREQLPGFSKGFDVVILPLLVNEYLHCAMPLTLLEQLAAGKVIVSTDLREIRRLGDLAILARDKHEFVSAIEQSLIGNNDERIQRGLAAASARSWDIVTREALDALAMSFAEQRITPRKDLSNGA